LNGQVSLHWKEIQHQYYIFLGKRTTGERWVWLLIQKIWDVAWDQWDHRNEVVHKQNNLVSQAESEQLNGWIREAIRIDSGLVMVGDNYLFHNISVDAAFIWTLARKKRWKWYVEQAWKSHQEAHGGHVQVT
jgi:hypothetical protein